MWLGRDEHRPDFMTPEQLNEDLANRLGRNPAAEGLYCWMHSDRWMHLMKTDRTEEKRLPSGLYAIEPVYEYRKMIVDRDDTWVLAHWHAPCSQYEWEHTNPGLLWPRAGYYAPTNILLSPGEQPTQTSNDQSVFLIKKQAAKTMADLVAESNEIVERKDRRYETMVSDRIDDSVSAFCNIPGTRSAHVSFPLPGSSQEKEYHAG